MAIINKIYKYVVQRGRFRSPSRETLLRGRLVQNKVISHQMREGWQLWFRVNKIVNVIHVVIYVSLPSFRLWLTLITFRINLFTNILHVWMWIHVNQSPHVKDNYILSARNHWYHLYKYFNINICKRNPNNYQKLFKGTKSIWNPF